MEGAAQNNNKTIGILYAEQSDAIRRMWRNSLACENSDEQEMYELMMMEMINLENEELKPGQTI
jgi:hypothetical protein